MEGRHTVTDSKKHIFFHWGNDSVSIGPTEMPELGKRPSLIVTRGNESHKIASFSSVEAAYEFVGVLEELFNGGKA